MEFIKTALPEVILIKPKVIGDSRGFFMESYKKSGFQEHGIDVDFVQDNHSLSVYGVLRGLHYQLQPKPQAKLVRCVSGKIFDVAVDIRIGSPNFGKWVGYEISAENKNMLYIPTGFAHGFLTLSDEAELVYKVDAEYNLACDRGILYNDPQINIFWPTINVPYILSDKDLKQPCLNNAEINFYMTNK